MDNMIPFGKYKNQPLEVLMKDPSYCEWLVSQSWFTQRFPNIHTLIINNFGEPSDTPEHNALQLRFLETGLRDKLAHLIMRDYRPSIHHFGHGKYAPFLYGCEPPLFEDEGKDISLLAHYWRPQIERTSSYTLGNPRNERVEARWVQESFRIVVECKTSLGDDYPAVLRFISRFPGYKVVVVQQYNFRGGTIEQVKLFFVLSNVLLVDIGYLDALPDVLCLNDEDLPPAIEYGKA